MSDAVALATDALRAMIARGDIGPGAELSQVGLARTIGVSTTPLREALRRLESEGLVEVPRNRRPRVPAFDPADLDAVYGNRILIESLGVALAVPRLDAAALGALRDTLAAMAATTELGGWDVLHRSFHTGLVGADAAPLREEIGRLISRSERYRLLSVRADGGEGRRTGEHEHEEILAACEQGDAQGAATLLAHHLARSALTVIANLAPDFDPATVRGALQMVIGWASR